MHNINFSFFKFFLDVNLLLLMNIIVFLLKLKYVFHSNRKILNFVPVKKFIFCPQNLNLPILVWFGYIQTYVLQIIAGLFFFFLQFVAIFRKEINSLFFHKIRFTSFKPRTGF